MTLYHTLATVTQRIIDRNHGPRQIYLDVTRKNAGHRVERMLSSCTNLAYGFATMPDEARIRLKVLEWPNLDIVSVYNNILSTHQPLEVFPAWLKQAMLNTGDTAQFTGGVPAMCDGVTQGQDGMELSLFSRDTVALSTAVALSHQMFDATLYLGVCNEIVPGLVVGAPSLSHLPVVLASADPMTTGINNDEKARTRQLCARGKLSRTDPLEIESKSYHGPGTCTFYGTTNPNQMLMEVMGLHLPGTAFINPDTPLREVLTWESTRQTLKLVFSGDQYAPITDTPDECAFVNDIAGLLATGNSTNHTLRLVAMVRAAGILLTWNNFNNLSGVIPLPTRVYSNDKADVNEFQAAGGPSIMIHGLIDAGLLYDDMTTITGKDLRCHAQESFLSGEKFVWHDGAAAPLDTNIVRGVAKPSSLDGGLRMLKSNIGCSVIKVSAVKLERRFVGMLARMFLAQDDLINAFRAGELEHNSVAVPSYQGPAASGMPELHKLMPTLSVLQERDFKVALVTDGRMLGASGKVSAAIHITPEALNDGPLARVRDGDIVMLGAEAGMLQARVPEAEWNVHQVTASDLLRYHAGVGRDLFSGFCHNMSAAGEGTYTLLVPTGV